MLTLQVLPKADCYSAMANRKRAAAGSPRRARRARPLASQAPDRARSSASLSTKKASVNTLLETTNLKKGDAKPGMRYTVGCGYSQGVHETIFRRVLKAALKGRCARSKAAHPTGLTLLCSIWLLDPLSPNLKSILSYTSKQKSFCVAFFRRVRTFFLEYA